MNPVSALRRLHNLPRVVLAVLLLALAQTVAIPCAMSAANSASMSAHCVYCPPHASGDMSANHAMEQVAGGCNYPHAPTVDAAKVSAQLLENALATASLTSPLQMALAMPSRLKFEPPLYSSPPPTRPLLLTFGVQLK